MHVGVDPIYYDVSELEVIVVQHHHVFVTVNRAG